MPETISPGRYRVLVWGKDTGQGYDWAHLALAAARSSLSGTRPGNNAEIRDTWTRESLLAVRLEEDGTVLDLPY